MTIYWALYCIVAIDTFGRRRWEDERDWYGSFWRAVLWPFVAAFHFGRWVGKDHG